MHDLDVITPPFRYYGAPLSRAFIPLDFTEEMTLAEILEKHPKGRDYAHIVQGKPVMPLIEDANGNVLSFPPIINGELTRVTEKTRNILLDVTGTDERAVMTAVKVITTALITAGAVCEQVLLNGKACPDLSPVVRDVSVIACNKLIGCSITGGEMVFVLEKMRYGAEVIDGETVRVRIPCYRADIMHDWGYFEDVAIGLGFESLQAALPSTSTLGSEHPVMVRNGKIRRSAVGFLSRR